MAYQHLQRICASFRTRLRRLLFEYGILRAGFLILGLAAVLMAADWYFRLSPEGRWAGLLGLLATAGLCYLFDFHLPLRRIWSDQDVLTYIDRASLNSDDVLLTLRDFLRPEKMREYESEQGKEIIRSVVAQLEQRANALEIAPLLQGRPVARWRRLTLALLAAYGLSLAVLRAPGSGEPYLLIGLKRLAMPNALVYWPQKTLLVVQEPEGGWRVPRGESFTVAAVAQGEIPPTVEIWYRSQGSDLWICERMGLNRETGQASFAFEELREPLRFYLSGGDDQEQRTFQVTVADRPIVTAIKADYRFPEYTRLGTLTTPSGQLSGIVGTQVDLEVKASTTLSRAAIRFELDGEEPSETRIEQLQGDAFRHSLRLTRSGRYAIELVDREGLRNGKPERYEIRVEPDKIPEVSLEEPKGDLCMTTSGTLRVRLRAKDDFDLKELSVMVAANGGKGEPLSDHITGPFWLGSDALHPVGEGLFDLELLPERNRNALKHLDLRPGTQLELWVHAVDCNPVDPGMADSPKVRISLLAQTDFMEEVVLKASRELLADAQTGWHCSAKAWHTGQQWLKDTPNEGLLGEVLQFLEGTSAANAALSLRFPEVFEHMQRNGMRELFMAKRLEAIGRRLHELNELVPKIAHQMEAGRPTSAAEDQPLARMAKLAKPFQGAQEEVNLAAWRYRLLYNRLADWISLQSILIKTRRIEEKQVEVCRNNLVLGARIMGRDPEELDEEEVREMQGVTAQQSAVLEMEEAVEKELFLEIRRAELEGRKVVWQFLLASFDQLQKRQTLDWLRRATKAIGDARGLTAKPDQEEVLHTIAELNRGLVRLGEQVPEDPPIAGPIEDPRLQSAPAPAASEVVEADWDPGNPGSLPLVAPPKPDSLEATLDEVARMQESARNRTMHVRDRIENGAASTRYLRLRSRLFARQQQEILGHLGKARLQSQDYGQHQEEERATGAKEEQGAGSQDARWEDPTLELARQRLAAQLGQFQAAAEEASRLLAKSAFDPFVSGLQDHVYRSIHDLRVYLQGREDLYKLLHARRRSNDLDPFERRYLVHSSNLATLVEAGQALEWALALQAECQREAELLGQFKDRVKAPLGEAQASADRLHQAARTRLDAIGELVRGAQQAAGEKVSDPSEPDRATEAVKPMLAKLFARLGADQFTLALREFEGQSYRPSAIRQDALRQSLAGVLVDLRRLFEERIPERPLVPDRGEKVPDPPFPPEPRYEQPQELAKRLEAAGWIDGVLGNTEARQHLIKRLGGMKSFDSRYARLQSAYFQALAQNFQESSGRRIPKPEPQSRQ